MNLVRRSRLLSFGRAPLWYNSCYKDIYKSTQFIDFEDDRKVCVNVKPSEITIIKCCSSIYPHNIPSLILWSQVRFQRDGCPRLHRDLEFPNFDPYRKDQYKDVRKTDWGAGDGKPGYTYVIGFFGLLGASYATKTILFDFASYMSAAADVLALATIEVDISKIVPGACGSFKWRGKPLFIKHRTEVDIESEAQTPMASLRDPQTPEQRCIKPEWLVVIGICTHLGCVPIPNSGDFAGGFYCPCHGSHYDNVGRARKGPAPTNLEVPPYKFVQDNVLLVG